LLLMTLTHKQALFSHPVPPDWNSVVPGTEGLLPLNPHKRIPR
jgi:hypothetical protein